MPTTVNLLDKEHILDFHLFPLLLSCGLTTVFRDHISNKLLELVSLCQDLLLRKLKLK